MKVTRIFIRQHPRSSLHLIRCRYSFLSTQVHLLFLITPDYSLKEGYILNSTFEASQPMGANNAISFLYTKAFTIKDSTFRSLRSTFGNMLTLKVEQLSFFLIENCLFSNNSGSNQVAADIKIEFELPINVDWGAFSETRKFGILNSAFQGSSLTGSICVSKNTEMLIENCTFSSSFSINGGVFEFRKASNVLLKNVRIKNARAFGKGGTFFVFQALVILQNVTVFDSSSADFGGVISSMSSVLRVTDSEFVSTKTATLGGLLWADDSTITFDRCLMRENSASLEGGHIYLKNSFIQISDSSLLAGSSLSAAAIYCSGYLLKLFHVNISRARSSEEEGLGTLFISYTQAYIEGLLCQNNSARAGACIFGQDSDVVVNRSYISENRAALGDIIQISFFDEVSSLKLFHTSFASNTAGKGLVSAGSVKTVIQLCSLDSNKVKSYYVACSWERLTVLDTSMIYDDKVGLEVTLLSVSKSELTEISRSSFGGSHAASLARIELVGMLHIRLSNFTGGHAQKPGGGLVLINSNAEITDARFENNRAGSEGAGAYILSSIVKISNSLFVSNSANDKGSDISIVSEGLQANLALTNCRFLMFDSSSISLSTARLAISSSGFMGLESKNLSSPALLLSDLGHIEIDKCTFQVTPFIFLKNQNKDFSLLRINNSIFEKRKRGNQPQALFLESRGNAKIGIYNCSFEGSFVSREDAFLAYSCLLQDCELILAANTIFTDFGTGSEKGHFVFSPSFQPYIGDTVSFNSDKAFARIYSKPHKILMTQETDILQKDDVDLIEELIARERGNEANMSISSRSGLEFNLGIVLIDMLGNLQVSQSGKNLEIFPAEEDQNLILDASPCQIIEGKCIFQKISLTGPSDRLYVFSLKYTHETGSITENLKIQLGLCIKGEIVYNFVCVRCIENFYSLRANTNGSRNTNCNRCPESATCPGGSLIIPNQGFWRMNENNSKVMPCLVEAACPYQKSWETKSHSDPLVFECGQGYYGNLCQECVIGYGVVNDSGCYECANSHLQNFINALKMILVLFFMAWDCHTSLATDISDHKTLLKILVTHTNYMIAVSSLSTDLSNEFKSVFSTLNNIVSTVPADLFNFHCFIKDLVHQEDLFIANSGIRLICICIYTILVYLLKLLMDLYLLLKRKQKVLQAIARDFSSTIILSFLIVYRNMYPRVLLALLTMVKCADLGEDQLFMEDNPNIRCRESQHLKYIGSISVVGILLWSFSVPALIFKFIHKRRDFLKEQNELIKKQRIGSTSYKTNNSILSNTAMDTGPQALQSQPENSQKALSFFALLTIDYQAEVYYWVIVENIIIFILLLISQLASDLNEVVRRLCLFLNFSVLLVIYQHIKPYTHAIHSKMNFFSLSVILITITFETVGKMKGNIPLVQEMAKWLLIGANIAFYALCSLLILRILYQQNKNDLSTKKLKDKLKSKFKMKFSSSRR